MPVTMNKSIIMPIRTKTITKMPQVFVLREENISDVQKTISTEAAKSYKFLTTQASKVIEMQTDKKYVIFVVWKANPEMIGKLDPKSWREMTRGSLKISHKYAETVTTTAFEPIHAGFRGADVIETDDLSEFYALAEEISQRWEGLRDGYFTVQDVIITLNRDFAAKVRAAHRIE